MAGCSVTLFMDITINALLVPRFHRDTTGLGNFCLDSTRTRADEGVPGVTMCVDKASLKQQQSMPITTIQSLIASILVPLLSTNIKISVV